MDIALEIWKRRVWWQGKALLSFTGLLVILLLAGCGTVKVHVTIYEREKWESEMAITIPQELVAMAGGEGALEAQLQEAISEAHKPGIKVSYHRELDPQGGMTYRLSTSGQGLSLLNEAVFDGQAELWVEESTSGKRLIHFRYNPASSALDITGLTLSLTGSEIISSNADYVQGDTATWRNLLVSGGAEAVLTEASAGVLGWFPIPLLASLVLLGVVVVGVVSFLVSRERRPGSLRPSPVPATRFCTQCGARNASTAKFCISCGKALTG